MGIGSKIKEYRTKKGLTQKDLADKLFVTYQAVSRWENDDAEPAFDVLREMCNIFECTMDDLFSIQKKEDTEENKNQDIEVSEEPKVIEERVQVIEKVVVQETKPVLAICEDCNKPIYDSDDLKRVEEKTHHRSGRTTHTKINKFVLCNSCNEKRLEEKKKEEERKAREKSAAFKRRRVIAFTVSTISFLVFLIISIVMFVNSSTDLGVGFLLFGVGSFTFLSCCILGNNFVGEMWLSIAGWSVRFPGVIFTLDLDGIIFLIVVKILFALLSFFISIFVVILATILSFLVSVVVYPFALAFNIKEKD